jgi:hypothetical protein
MKQVEQLNNIDAYQSALFFEKMFKIAVRKAQEEHRQKGLYNVYSFNGRLMYELPNGELTYEKPIN